MPALYRSKPIGEYRIDLIVENAVVVEIKSVERFDRLFEAQVLTYLKVTGKKVGLLLNFNSRLLKKWSQKICLESPDSLCASVSLWLTYVGFE
jgi:GxxExxY protein